MAMEGNKKIFKAILKPLIVDPITKSFRKQQLDGNGVVDDVEVEVLLNQYCK